MPQELLENKNKKEYLTYADNDEFYQYVHYIYT
jgi:hypothetical protein